MNTKKTQVMGILNITPDSFSDGGLYYDNPIKAVERVKEMLTCGADIIDIGGESTRPGSETVDAKEEIKRVLPLIQTLTKQFPQATFSIDTWKHEVAKQALANGCTMINSLGGFMFDEKLADVVAKSNSPIIIYHIKGKPKSMQQGDITYDDVVKEIFEFFQQQIKLGKKYGINKKQFILDPGIGFGKTVEQNVEIIRRLEEFNSFNLPIAVGISRKNHLGLLLKQALNLETSPTERLEASLAETAIALQNGADIIRTHDVLETKKFVTVLEKFI